MKSGTQSSNDTTASTMPSTLAQELGAILNEALPSERGRKNIASLIETLADCADDEAAIKVAREFVPDVMEDEKLAYAAGKIAAFAITFLGGAAEADRLHDPDDDYGLSDEEVESARAALEHGVSDGSLLAASMRPVPRPAPQQKPSIDPDVPLHADVLRGAIAKCLKGDAGAIFELIALASASVLRAKSPAEYFRVVTEIQRVTNKATAAKWEREVRHRLREYGARLGKEQAELDNKHGIGAPVEKIAIGIIKEQTEQFADRSHDAYVVTTGDGPRRVIAVESGEFARWVRGLLWEHNEKVLNATQLTTVVEMTKAIASATKSVRDVHIRVASVGDCHYIDIGDDEWRVIEVTADGWRILDKSPVEFIRGPNTRPLPIPDRNGSVEALWKFLNIHEHDRLKVIAWLCSTYRTSETNPVLAIQTRPNSGKSTTTKFLRRLFDPDKKEHSRLPKNPDDLLIAGLNSYAVCIDNIDYLSHGHQDTCCVLSTGTALGGRKLYTNHGEASSEFIRRPLILNGVNAFITRADLNSRAIIIDLPQFKESRTDDEAETLFQDNYASAFGGLLTVYSRALALLPEIKREYRGTVQPRAVAYAYLGEAISRVLGNKPSLFLSDFRAEQDDKAAGLAADDEVGAAICEKLSTITPTNGVTVYSEYVGKLLTALRPRDRACTEWPASPKRFANHLRYLEQSLAVLGISIEHHVRDRNGIKVTFRQEQKKALEWKKLAQARQRATITKNVVSVDAPSNFRELRAAILAKPNGRAIFDLYRRSLH